MRLGPKMAGLKMAGSQRRPLERRPDEVLPSRYSVAPSARFQGAVLPSFPKTRRTTLLRFLRRSRTVHVRGLG